ncbi:MAG: hypothetical protein JST54_21635 [Deltaproteobacteria bacterium]|nr:hypothetical protein [Deltaproteobacteria bacterium]
MGTDVRGFEVVRASSCGASWSTMSGSACARTCSLCRLRVLEVDGLSRPQVQALVGRERPQFFVREDGTLLLSDCPLGRSVRERQRRRRGSIVAALIGVILGFAVSRSERDATLVLSDPFTTWPCAPSQIRWAEPRETGFIPTFPKR